MSKASVKHGEWRRQSQGFCSPVWVALGLWDSLMHLQDEHLCILTLFCSTLPQSRASGDQNPLWRQVACGCAWPWSLPTAVYSKTSRFFLLARGGEAGHWQVLRSSSLLALILSPPLAQQPFPKSPCLCPSASPFSPQQPESDLLSPLTSGVPAPRVRTK